MGVIPSPDDIHRVTSQMEMELELQRRGLLPATGAGTPWPPTYTRKQRKLLRLIKRRSR